MSRTDRPDLHDVIEDYAQNDGSYAIAFAVLKLAETLKLAATDINTDGLTVNVTVPPALVEILRDIAAKHG